MNETTVETTAPIVESESEAAPRPLFRSERRHYEKWPSPGRTRSSVTAWEQEHTKQGEPIIRWYFGSEPGVKSNLSFTTGLAWRNGNNLDALLTCCDYPRNDEMVPRLDPDWLIGVELYVNIEYLRNEDTGDLSIQARPMEPLEIRQTRRPWDHSAPAQPRRSTSGPINVAGYASEYTPAGRVR